MFETRTKQLSSRMQPPLDRGQWKEQELRDFSRAPRVQIVQARHRGEVRRKVVDRRSHLALIGDFRRRHRGQVRRDHLVESNRTLVAMLPQAQCPVPRDPRQPTSKPIGRLQLRESFVGRHEGVLNRVLRQILPHQRPHQRQQPWPIMEDQRVESDQIAHLGADHQPLPFARPIVSHPCLETIESAHRIGDSRNSENARNGKQPIVNTSLLKELTEAHGTSGYEDALRVIVRRELGPLTDITSDAMGNLICRKKGSGDGPKVMIAAHMDEIGFVVKYIDKDGFIRLNPLGGWDPRQMNSQRVIVTTANGPLSGVLMYGTKPAHMLSDSEKKEGQNIDSFFVDLGLSGDEVKQQVRVGDQVTMDGRFAEIGNHFTCKTMDDRVAVFVMIEAMKALGPHVADIYAVATVQEEIGLRGAAASGWSIEPDVAIAIDITLANDIPGIPEQDHVTKLGQGAAIKIMDSSLICHPKVVAHFREIAEANSIKYQDEILSRGGTDAGAIQRLHGGVPSFTLSIPCRYVHTVNETVHPDDVQACIDLLARYLEKAHEGNYAF